MNKKDSIHEQSSESVTKDFFHLSITADQVEEEDEATEIGKKKKKKAY